MRPIAKAILAACAAAAAVAAPSFARAEADPLRDPFARAVRNAFPVQGLHLFDKRARSAGCVDSAAPGLVWCAAGPAYETAEGGTFVRTFGYNLDADGRVVYVILTRREFPLARAKFEETIKTLGARYPRAPTTLKFEGKTVDGDEVYSVIAYWGGIKLVRLNAAEMRIVARTGTLGHGPLVDHRQDIRLSAGRGDPVYKVEGTAGFIAEFRSVTDVRTDVVMRVVYQPAFTGEREEKPEPKVAAPQKFRELPLDPRLAFALDKIRAEQERLAAIERARRAEEERRAAEERARRAEAERKAAEARRIAEEKRAAEERKAAEARRIAEEKRLAEERARRAEEERKAAEARRIAEEKRAAEERVRRAEEERKAAERKAAEERAAAARKIAEEKAAIERRIAEEKARREAAERAAAEEKARREAVEKKAAEARRLAEERARREEAERKAAEAKRLAEERARLEEAERKAAAERRAIEERVRKAEAEYRASLERAQRAEAERRAAEERARQAEAERKAAEERARRVEAERKAAEERRAEERRQADRRAAEERARREEAERKAAAERRAAEARRATAERKAAEEKAAAERRAAEQRRAAAEKPAAERKDEPKPAEEKRTAEAPPPAPAAAPPAASPPAAAPPAAPAKPRAEPRDGARPPQYAGAEPGAAGPSAPAPEAGREEWLRFAIAQSRQSPVAWIFERARDRISDDILLRTRAIFPGDGRAAIEIAFECNIGAGKRLTAYVRAFDERTNAALPLPVEDGRSGVVRGGVVIDEEAPQTAFLFPERGERQASIVEIPLGHDDIRKNTPRARAWLRHYRVVLKVRAAKSEITAAIYPYADNLRRVLEACVP